MEEVVDFTTAYGILLVQIQNRDPLHTCLISSSLQAQLPHPGQVQENNSTHHA